MLQTSTIKTLISTINPDGKKSLFFLMVKIKRSSEEKKNVEKKQLAAQNISFSKSALEEHQGLQNILLGNIRMEIETEQNRRVGLHQVLS